MTFNLMVAKGTYTSHREQDSVIFAMTRRRQWLMNCAGRNRSDVTLDGLVTLGC